MRTRFIEKHLTAPSLASLHVYDLDVAAFCVLAHGVIENALEDIAHTTAELVYRDFWTANKITRATLALVLYYGKQPKDDGHTGLEVYSFRDLKNVLDQARADFIAMLGENNGIRDVEKFCRPIGIELKLDIVEQQAVESLANFRGARAHGAPIYTPTAPSDAWTLVRTVLAVTRRIAVNAATRVKTRPVSLPDVPR